MQENQPITTILKIRYKEGFKEECLQWMLETASIASCFDGFIEKNICLSVEAERELLNIFTFSNNQSLQVWENSEQRIRQTKISEAFVETIQSKSQLASLEFWL
jgi:antibiotic biosynthesis monooxygenase (ABM) superfamily enzyme